MVPIDVLLLFAAFLCVLQFAVTVSYMFRRNDPSYHLVNEIIAHLTASAMVFMIIIASRILNKPEFEDFGIAMAVVMVIYYMFTLAELSKDS